MAAPPKVTLAELTQALARARRQLAQRNFSPGGDIYRDFAEPLDTFARFIEQQEALAMKPLDHQTLKEGSYIWQTVQNWGLEEQVRRIGQLPTADDKVRRYRVEIDDLGAMEGTSEQIVALLRHVPMKPSPDMAALAYQEIEQPEPPAKIAQPAPEPEVAEYIPQHTAPEAPYQGERVVIATSRYPR